MKLLKRLILITVILLLAFIGYVLYANRHYTNMTFRQKFLKTVYPVFMWWSKTTGKGNQQLHNTAQQPPVSFYSLKAIQNNNEPLDFATLKGKKVMLVNTASNCGYTSQYSDLEKLYETYQPQLVILAFPANDFKQQEKGSDTEIAEFCKQNFGVSFPLMKKSVVIKTGEQNEVYRWLTDSTKNGWNNKPPSWNFSKYLINENGILIDYFGPAVSPLSDAVQQAIKKN